MTTYYLDTSALVKRYVDEDGLTPLTFLSADDRLNDAASTQGIAVDNPNHHP